MTRARLILYALAAVVAALALWWLYSTITARPKAEARLGKNTTEAAIGSGKDAVATVGARGAAESDLDKEVGNATRNIENAPDGAAADAAGRDGLCRIAGDRFCEHPVH
jgi:hypothetical protein